MCVRGLAVLRNLCLPQEVTSVLYFTCYFADPKLEKSYAQDPLVGSEGTAQSSFAELGGYFTDIILSVMPNEQGWK